MIKTDIYRSFKQWKNGNVMEHGVSRTEYYSEAQLDLIEMGWKYGYDAGRAVEQALDKKAENARELGLDYEPTQPLTDEQIRAASLQAGMQEHYMGFHSGFIQFTRAIEAAHGITGSKT